MLFHRSGNESKPQVKTIESFETVTLRLSGMRGSTVYRIQCEGEESVIGQYTVRYAEGSDTLVPEYEKRVPTEEVLETFARCGVAKWDGFNGKHPRGVLDGLMFRFEAVVNGGITLNANGSQNFPKGFREFRDYLYGVLRG